MLGTQVVELSPITWVGKLPINTPILENAQKIFVFLFIASLFGRRLTTVTSNLSVVVRGGGV
jgi:hypothetical protein